MEIMKDSYFAGKPSRITLMCLQHMINSPIETKKLTMVLIHMRYFESDLVFFIFGVRSRDEEYGLWFVNGRKCVAHPRFERLGGNGQLKDA